MGNILWVLVYAEAFKVGLVLALIERLRRRPPTVRARVL